MKQLLILISLLVISSISICCKTKKEASNSIVTKEIPSAMEDEKVTQYRLILTFISKGTGVDSKLKSEIFDYISSHPKKPVNKIVLWGREGETDHCFLLKELSKTEKVEFIARIKKIIGTSDMVLLIENSKCNHQGR